MLAQKVNLLNLLVILALILPGGPQPTAPALKPDFGQLPLYFVENRGQVDERVAYYIQGSDKTLYFTSEGVTFALTRPSPDESSRSPKSTISSRRARDEAHGRPLAHSRSPTPPYSRWAVKLDFVGANPNVRPIGQSQTEAVFSYFKGKPDEWHTGLRTYSRIVYTNLWPGIDLVYYGTVNQLKYEFVVRPGADPNQIRLAYRGATDVRLNAAGQLEVTAPLGGFADDVPTAYQETAGGQRVAVPIAYALEQTPLASLAFLDPRSAIQNPKSYGFRLGDYDPALPLVLDPAVLVYAGYIGGADWDQSFGIAVDGAGNVYVTGETHSTQATFPVTGGPDLTHNGSYYDAFVAKVNPAGTGLVYTGYIGGAGDDSGDGIAVDGAGSAYVTGETYSAQATFPVTVGPDLTHNFGSDAFVAKVNPAGTGLVYAGYIGGNSFDHGLGIAVDGVGNAYVTGSTGSTEATFPVTVGPDLTYNGSSPDAFVAKVNVAGTGLVYAGYIGGAGQDYSEGIAVDGAGNAYVTGYTNSTEATLPAVGGPDLTYNGGSWDAFVAKVGGFLDLPISYFPGGLNQPPGLRPLFDWGNVSGASSYNLQISTNQNFTSLVLNLNLSPSAYVPTADLPKGMLLFWRVRANGSNGPSAWSRIRHFDTPNPPGVPILLTPAHNATAANGQPTLDWSDSSPGVDHYEVQISTSATFAGMLGRGQGGRTAASQYTPEVALAPGPYYWRVRAVNSGGQFSNWSSGRSFVVP